MFRQGIKQLLDELLVERKCGEGETDGGDDLPDALLLDPLSKVGPGIIADEGSEGHYCCLGPWKEPFSLIYGSPSGVWPARIWDCRGVRWGSAGARRERCRHRHPREDRPGKLS